MNKRFFKWLGIYAMAGFALILLVLGILWQWLCSYELSRPEVAMADFFAEADQEYWLDQFRDTLDTDLTQFETEDDYFQTLYTRFFRGCVFTYTPSTSYTKDSPVYTVRSNGVAIATVTLTHAENGKVGFGMNKWTVDQVTAVDFMDKEKENVTIIAPSTSKVTLNGIALDDSYITDPNLQYDNLSLFEMMEGYDAPHRVKYTIPGIYMQPTVVVENAEMVISDGLNYEYRHTDMGSHPVDITVPSGSIVTIGGIEVDADSFAKGETLEGFAGLGSFVSTLPHNLSLNLEGFLVAPTVEVRDWQGNALTPDEDGLYSLQESASLEDQASAMVQDFAQDYIDFCTNIKGDMDYAYQQLYANLLKGTSLQTRLSQASVDLVWVYGVSNELHELTVSDFVQYGEDVASCTMHFALTSVTNYENREIDETYTIGLIKSNGTWKVASMLSE